jgi:hypothetical protein
MPIQCIRYASLKNTHTTKHTKKNNTMHSGGSNKKWPYLSLKTVNKLETLADYYNISHKARGLQKPTKSDEGFLKVYRKYKGRTEDFEQLPVRANKPDGEKWQHHREDFCNRRYAMIDSKKNYGLYDVNGLPTVMHTNMLMWACSPDAKNITKNTKKILNILEDVKKDITKSKR